MKRSTTNKLNMYQNVVAVLNDYHSVWESVPVFVEAVTTLTGKLGALKLRITEQSTLTTGVSAEKQLRISDLRERMLVVQKALMLHGRATGNVPLM